MGIQSINPSVISKIEGMIWRCKSFLFKRWIAFQDRFGLYSYADWIRDNELTDNKLKVQARRSLEFENRPLLSCLLMKANASDAEFERTITSLLAQTYDRWEAFCFIPPGEIDGRTRPIIDNDPRLRLLDGRSEEDFFINGDAISADKLQHILSEGDNIRGEFVCFLAPGDTIAPTLFYRVIEQLNQNPDIDLFYTDEDHAASGSHERHSPFFKPDWSAELLCSIDYLKFSIVRLSHLRRVCAVSEAKTLYDEFILHCADEARHISHLAEVTIHFGDRPEIGDLDTRNSRHGAVIKKYLERKGLSGVQVESTSSGVPHITWKISHPLVSIIIPTKDCLPYFQRAVESIRQLTAYEHYELVIVDNDSCNTATLEYYEQLKQGPNVQIVRYPGRFNFSEALNKGVSQAHGELFIFLNNDVQIIDPAWLTELAQWALLPKVGIVGAKLLYPDGAIQHAGLVLGMQGHANHIFSHFPEGANGLFGSVEWYRNYSAVTGACMAMRRNVFDELGGFNTDYQLAFSDIEMCLEAIRRGYRVVYNPFARLIHHEGRSRSRSIPTGDIETGYSRFHDLISKGDPFYNPNLSTAVRYPTFRRKNEESPKERLDQIKNYYGI
jgi:O-antigen biosynthesis protein